MPDLLTTGALVILLVSFAIGIVVGVTGMGGGALLTPALIFLGINPTVAVANDLVAAGLNRTVGAAVHLRQGSPYLPLVKWLVVGSVPTAFAGAFLVRAVGASDNQQHFLRLAIGAALLLTAVTYTARMVLQLREQRRGLPTQVTDPPVRPAPTLLVGIVGGLLVGITSVGAGSLMMVSLLLLYPTLSAVKLVGTDLLQAVPLVIAAAASHVIVDGVDWGVLIPLIVGGTPGTYLGSRLAARVSPAVIRRGIVILLTITGIALLGAAPLVVGLATVAIVVLGPLAWALIRRAHGLPPFARIRLTSPAKPGQGPG